MDSNTKSSDPPHAMTSVSEVGHGVNPAFVASPDEAEGPSATHQESSVNAGPDSSSDEDEHENFLTLLPGSHHFKNQKKILSTWRKSLISVTVAAAYVAYVAAVLAIETKAEETNYWCEADGLVIIITGLLLLGLFYFLIVKKFWGEFLEEKLIKPFNRLSDRVFRFKWIPWAFFLLLVVGAVVFIALDSKDNRRLQSLLGVVVLLLFGFVFSIAPKKVRWRHVAWGMALQFILGLIILRWPFGRSVFECLARKVATFLGFTDEGSGFVFGDLANPDYFAFSVLPVILFFGFCMQILYYYGVMQWVIIKLGWLLQVTIGTTACESVNAAGNIFLGQTEAPLLIKPYIPIMTKSELHAVLTGGFATVAGSVMAAYITFGVDPAHLLSASVMSAPAALAFAKLFYPETKKSRTSVKNVQMVKGFEVDMNPYSRAAKILAASAGLSKMPPERDTLNNNEIQCIPDVMHQHIEPTGNFADSLRPVAVLSPSKVPNNEGSPTYNVTEMTPATPWVGNTSPPVPASAFRKMDSTPPLSSTEEIATTLFCPGTQYQQLEPNPTGTSQYHQNAAPKNGASQRRDSVSSSSSNSSSSTSSSDSSSSSSSSDSNCSSSSSSSNSSRTTPTASSDKHEWVVGGSKRTGKRRIRDKSKWKQNMKKQEIQSGMKHITNKGKTVQKNVPVPLGNHKCRVKCSENITEADRQRVNATFWKTASSHAQHQYVADHVDLVEIKQGKTRSASRKYHITIKGKRQKVCRDFFLKTLHISNSFVDKSVTDKQKNEGYVHTDKRGWRKGTGRKYSEKDELEIQQHIESFPELESHYYREKSQGIKYLNENLNSHKMYMMYRETVANPVKEWKYKEVLDLKYKVKFGLPSIDACDLCAKLTTEELSEHTMLFTAAFEEMKKDHQQIPGKHVATFDLQKVLPCPLLPYKDWFYKRTLSMYNLTICPNGKNPECYTWHEAVGKRGSNAIASCLAAHIAKLPSDIKHIVLYSDSCSGQNRNKYTAAAMMLELEKHPNIKLIDMKFLVPGHTYMNVDGVHGRIERAKTRNLSIHVPSDWNCFLRQVSARSEETKLHVFEMNPSDFKDYSTLFQGRRSVLVNNKASAKMEWLRVRWLRFMESEGGEHRVLYKYSFSESEEFKTANWTRNPCRPLVSQSLPEAYPGGVPVSAAKKKDLMSLLPYIRDETQKAFYEGLASTSNDLNADGNEDDEKQDESFL